MEWPCGQQMDTMDNRRILGKLLQTARRVLAVMRQRSANGADRLPVGALPETRTLDQQWLRLETLMCEDLDKAHVAVRKHAVAALHLDAAHYTLGRIAEELAVAMPPIELKPAVPVSVAFPVAGYRAPMYDDAIAA